MTRLLTTPRKLILAAALAAFGAASAHAAAPLAKTGSPGYFRMMLGDFEVTALNDGTIDLPVDKLLKTAPATTNKALKAAFLATPVETSVNAFLINTGSKLVLIDAGAGGLFGPTSNRLVESLKASGYQPEQVDEIYITHLHGDHIGGVSKDGAALYPNAVLRAGKLDAEHWLSQAKLDKAPADGKADFKGPINAVAPYQAKQRFKPIDGDIELVPGVKSYGTHGHTPGHTSYVVESKGQKLILTGDLIHVGAVQFGDPSVTIEFDSDQKAALAQRLKVFAAAEKEGALIGASHIQFPGLGHLRSAGKGYQWVPVNYTRAK